jgi:hypothetical protein
VVQRSRWKRPGFVSSCTMFGHFGLSQTCISWISCIPPKSMVRHNETSSTVCWFACKVLYFLLGLFYEKFHLDISHWTWAKLSWCSFANRVPCGWYETGNRGSNDPDVPIQVVPKLVLE